MYGIGDAIRVERIQREARVIRKHIAVDEPVVPHHALRPVARMIAFPVEQWNSRRLPQQPPVGENEFGALTGHRQREVVSAPRQDFGKRGQQFVADPEHLLGFEALRAEFLAGDAQDRVNEPVSAAAPS